MREIIIAGFQECKAGEFLKLGTTSIHDIKKMELISEHPLDNDCVFMVEGIRLKDGNKECDRVVLNKGQTAVKVPCEYNSLINILSENTPSSKIRVMFHIGEPALRQLSTVTNYEPDGTFNFGGLGGSIYSLNDFGAGQSITFGYNSNEIRLLIIGEYSYGSTDDVFDMVHATIPEDGIVKVYRMQCNTGNTLSYFEGYFGITKLVAGAWNRDRVTFDGNVNLQIYQVICGDAIDSLSFIVK